MPTMSPERTSLKARGFRWSAKFSLKLFIARNPEIWPLS
jgi:hypothetical protein